MTIILNGYNLTRQEVVQVARDAAEVTLGEEGRSAMEASAEIVEAMAASGVPTYGVSTGFGALAATFIPEDRRRELQLSLIRSHAAGMGPRVEPEVVRAMMLLRARSLAMGHSGARPVLVENYLSMLAHGITPVVHEYGSLGASGDLAPLAHIALALIGEGTVTINGVDLPAADALRNAGLSPLELRAKEGLALINGTDGILGMLLMAIADLEVVLASADIIASMTTEALLGTNRAFAARLVGMRPQPGQAVSAANMTRVMANSEIVASHLDGDTRVQDAYSLRCTPQVHGAARDTLTHAISVAENELVSTIDNPVVMPDGSVESCGNFHGAPVAFVCDFLAIAAAEVGSIAERRLDRMLDPARSHGLPPFLTEDAGVSSGYMIAHYTAVSIAAENRRLASPASVDSMPTSAMQEDHVSMGWSAARKLRTSVHNVARILAVELVAACQALDLRAPLTPSPASAAVRAHVRETIPHLDADRELAPELAQATELVLSGAVIAAAIQEVGPID